MPDHPKEGVSFEQDQGKETAAADRRRRARAGVGVHGRAAAGRAQKNRRTAAPADLLAERITAIGELATVEYHYTNMAKFENSLELYGWTVPLTQSSFVLSYDGVIKAGVDLSSVRVTQSGTTFTITLTKPAILSH